VVCELSSSMRCHFTLCAEKALRWRS